MDRNKVPRFYGPRCTSAKFLPYGRSTPFRGRVNFITLQLNLSRSGCP